MHKIQRIQFYNRKLDSTWNKWKIVGKSDMIMLKHNIYFNSMIMSKKKLKW